MCLGLVLALSAGAAQAETATRVFLNGVPAPVYFNDGDSFRVLGGPLKGTKARLAGFNTLESYGPAHSWGTWDAHELYALAKLATLNAQRGVWHCESPDMAKDTYGRILWVCLDLAVDQVKRGLAHVMTVTQDAGIPEVVAAQKDAIANHRGMWAHGVPEYIMTSTHSAADGGGRDGITYNRLISTLDGHTEKWQHTDDYKECEIICHKMREVTPATISAFVEALRASDDSAVKVLIERLSQEELEQRVRNYINFGQVGWMTEKADAVALTNAMIAASKDITLDVVSERKTSCMIYVDFRRRYGSRKAACLK